MKIYVKLIDASNNKQLNDTFVVLIDEPLKIVKERLFFYNNENKYYPNFLMLTRSRGSINDDNDDIVLKNQLLVNYTVKDDKIIYVNSILDTLETEIKNDISINNLYEDYKNNNDHFTNVYNKVINTYKDLTEDDFVGVIAIILHDKYNRLTPEYKNFLEEIQHCHQNISNKYESYEESFADFYQSCKNDDLSEYYNTGLASDGVPNIIFKDVTVQFKHHDFVSGTKGRFIKLQSIFNQFALSENVPMMAISNEKDNPIIKVYDNISNNVSTKEFKSWILHDKKEKSVFGKGDETKRIVSYKKIKGLLLKIKHESPKTDYITMNIYDNGIIECRIKFNDSSENNDNLDIVITELKNSIENCIQNINKLNGIYTQSKRLDICHTACDVIFESITCSVELNKKIDLDNIINIVIDEHLQDHLFQLKEGKSKDVISLYYKKFLKTDETTFGKIKLLSYLELPQTERKGITVNIQDNPYSIGSILNIYSASNINEIYLIVDQIAYIDKLNEETEETRKQKIKEKSNIKNLRNEYGIPILSTSCQKQRQPIIDDTVQPLSGMIDKKTKKPLVDSYPLIYNGIRLICPNEDYPYPGFTQKNAICCFTKDQRSNSKYISNMGLEDTQKDKGVKKQVNKYILTTDKILEDQKIGTLLTIFDNVFNKLPSNIKDIKNGMFYRIGVNQNNNAFLNAISLGIYNREIDINKFKKDLIFKLKENPNLFYKLNNGQIKSKYKDLKNYIHWILDNNNVMNVNDLIEFLQVMYKINIFIFNIPMIYSKSTAKIDEDMIKIHCHINCKPDIENPYVVVFKREKKFELLIYYNTIKTKYNFNKQDSEVFDMINDFYSKTCIKEEVYPKKYSQYNYDKLYNGNDIISSLKGTDHEIIGQVSKKNKKITSLITKDNILIPITESTLFLEKDNNSKELPVYYQSPLINGNEFLEKLKDVNKIFKKNKLVEIKVIGITHKNDGLVTNLSGFIIPILQTNNMNLQKVKYNYYPINSGIETSDSEPTEDQEKNKMVEYTDNYNNVQNEIYTIKQQLSNIIYNSKKLTKYIHDIQKSEEYFNLSKFKMIQLYNDIFNKIIDIMKDKHNVEINNNTLYLSIISNDIIDDNKENLFFKGIVKKPDYDINEIKLYSNESVVYNMKDFYNYVKTHFNHDIED